jgi:hypothetical protein
VSRIEWLTHDHFADRVGEHFEMRVADGPPVVLELVEATLGSGPGGQGPDGEERRQFSLVFRGPATPVVPQGTYPLDHTDMVGLELFLVPLGTSADGTRYEAAFA